MSEYFKLKIDEIYTSNYVINLFNNKPMDLVSNNVSIEIEDDYEIENVDEFQFIGYLKRL